MKHIYQDHLHHLREISTDKEPVTSLYVPMKNPDLPPERIFQALEKSARQLYAAQGFKAPQILTPTWDIWRDQKTQTLGIFSSNESTTVLPLPNRLSPRFVVARSFHVKPIIAAASETITALLLNFTPTGLSMYRVDNAGASLLREYVSLEHFSTESETVRFILRELKSELSPETKLLAVSGKSRTSSLLMENLQSFKMTISDLRNGVPMNLTQTVAVIRFRLAQMISEAHSKLVRQFSGTQYQDPITAGTLIPAIRQRKIRNLCVSLDKLLFGKIDTESGAIVLSQAQRSAEDDDVLDDLAEYALDKGVNVSVVPGIYLPSGRAFLAS